VSAESTTGILKCSAAQLRSLLALAIEQPGEYGALLARVRDVDEVARLLAAAQGLPETETGMVAALAARETSLADVRGMRGTAKALIAHAKNNGEREAAAFAYHAATAAALGRHAVNLSAVPPQSRVPLYEDLAAALGAHPLAEVFREAVDVISSLADS
jgi:hypothetical protein